MLRVVKAPDTGDAAFFLLCDHRCCMEARRGSALITNADDYQMLKKKFLKTAMEEGWWIDLEGVYCPAHAREMLQFAREAKEKGQQVVAAARPQDVLAFGKGRA
jgi:hypothetical protein